MSLPADKQLFRKDFPRTLPRRHSNAQRHLLEQLESRTLLSATLFVTSPATPADATHFQTLQAALAVAIAGDTVILQSGFSAGSYVTTALSLPAAAGSTSLHTLAALSVGEVVTIGQNTAADPAERDLVTAVSPTGSGDFLVTLASALQFAHSASPVDAGNSTSLGKTIGIGTSITLTADPGVVLPFNLEVWKGTSGTTLSNLNLTAGAATSLFIDGDGNALNNINAANQIVLNNAHNNTLTSVTVGNRLFVDTGSSGNLVTTSTLKQVTLQPGSHDNTFTSNAIVALAGVGATAGGSGGDHFQQNTFTGVVKITGNFSATTNDAFTSNMFTLSTGDGLTLFRADGTTVTGNTFAVSQDYANAIVVGDSGGVVVVGNQVTTTGTQGTALYAYSELNFTTSLDVRDNLLKSTDGWGLYFAKYDTTAPFEARVQGNDLRNNAYGVTLFGDGSSGGNVDLGGGATSFGSSTGGNDFRSFTLADDSHYAIGIADTSSNFTLLAHGNKFAALDPMAVVSDAAHDLAAGGSGIILATAAVSETLALSANNSSLVQTQSGAPIVAHFTSNLPHTTADFLATVDWGDGSSSVAAVVANAGGGFDVVASHEWDVTGNFTITVSVSSNAGGTASAAGHVAVESETLSLAASNLAVVQTSSTNGVVAHFSSNIAHGTSDFTATISYNDGTSGIGTIVAHAGGGFDVIVSRSWNSAGSFSGTIKLTDTLGNSAKASGNVTVTPRILAATAPAMSIEKGTVFNGTIATFTDNMLGTSAASYIATIKWSDGLVTAATVTKNPDNTFSISTSRSFSDMGALTAQISISTADGRITTTTSQEWLITNKNNKVPPGKMK